MSRKKIYKKLLYCVILVMFIFLSCAENADITNDNIGNMTDIDVESASVSKSDTVTSDNNNDNAGNDVSDTPQQTNPEEIDEIDEIDELEIETVIDELEEREESTENITNEIITESPEVIQVIEVTEVTEVNNFEHSDDEIIKEENKNILENAINTIMNNVQNNNVEDSTGEITEILISAIGDVSLASNYVKPYANSFYNYYDLYGAAYFFENVLSVFSNDDITIANLESALTNSENRVNKQYCYKGKPEYANILTEGNIEIVNLENNHIFDYSQEGYDDTVSVLQDAEIEYFGNGVILLREVKGIKIGFISCMGSSDVSNGKLQRLKNALLYLEENDVDVKIVSFHWGIVDEKIANDNQRLLAHFAVDNGADLILGHHPHVLQGIEKYKDKYIVYSLGNFIFDGNIVSDDDHRTSIIFQQKFVLQDNVIIDSNINIIPVHATSTRYANSFQPMVVDDSEKERILKKIEDRSP